jgi:NAD(P)-dependent dehydrogenase (short-subunit alcohol dehydrogenase family)
VPLPFRFRALVIGSTGGIGSAFVELLSQDPNCSNVEGLNRKSVPAIDFAAEASIAAAAEMLGAQAKFHLIIVATGILQDQQATPLVKPEKRLAELSYAQMMHTFQVNTFGPAMVLRHFVPLLHPEGGVLAVLSAKVGSIEDNRLGGWYSYRASKAALNMLLKTAAIEVKRTHPHAALIALHPGTVDTHLSQPFKGHALAREALAAARDMLTVIESLSPEDSGKFFAFDGEELPW